MSNIRVDTSYTIQDGSSVVFTAPCNCNAITGLKVYYPDGSKEFVFKDAHGNALTGLGNLFSKGAYVKVILDVTNGFAYIQNADTNAYIEGVFKELFSKLGSSIFICAMTSGVLSVKMPLQNILMTDGSNLKVGDVLISTDGFMYRVSAIDELYEIADLQRFANLNSGGGSGGGGEDGFSPLVTIQETDEGAVITITDKYGTTSAVVNGAKNSVCYTPQDLTPAQQAQARANIDALKVPREIKSTKDLFLFVEEDDGFQNSGNLMVYKIEGKQDWLNSPDDFDFRVRFTISNGIAGSDEYEFTKADCTLPETEDGIKHWVFYSTDRNGTTRPILTVANGISAAGFEGEDYCSLAYPADLENYSVEFYRLTNAGRELRVVTSVNGVEADENGNASVPQRSDAEIAALVTKQTEARFLGIEQQLAEILYNPINISSFTAKDTATGKSTLELGTNVESVTFAWKFSKAPKSVTFNGKAMPVDSTGDKLELTVTRTKSWTLEVTDERDTKVQKSASLTFLNGVYYGALPVDETIDSAAILTLGKKIQSGCGVTFKVSPTSDVLIAYAIPASGYGTPSFKLDNGFAVDMYRLDDPIQFENALGYVTPYYVWLSTYPQTKEITVIVS